ncbi:MAG: translesion DNA synthesis-associated protein ImuA, partial [Kangiellaceae bacterium]|nr:translesion DNA synthesis-associated protein ImuA [Kangiellaceae bacterium]
MNKSQQLNKLLSHPSLWQANQGDSLRPVASTGFTELDKQLHDGGWPQGRLSELLIPHDGVGELRLLAPLLKALSQQSGFLVMVNPPFLPYLPALHNLGITTDKLLVIREHDRQKMIWATYQALVSRSCSAVLVWLPDQGSFKTELRKLSLGARHSQCWSFVVRDMQASQLPSPACLRLKLDTCSVDGTNIEILKQPGGWAGQKLKLDLFPERWQWTSLAGTYWPTANIQSNQSKVNRPQAVNKVNTEELN